MKTETTIKLKKGSRVTTTGAGRTARWGTYTGTVNFLRNGNVFVAWDGTSFEDEMRPEEVRKISA